MKALLKDKIENKKALIGVVGMGYVGLPLAVLFAGNGFKVLGLEQDPKKRRSIAEGKSYIGDVESSELKSLVKEGKLKAVGDYKALKSTDAVCICVPTPLDKNKQPDITFVKSVSEAALVH
jgi:UDP-N-acetyl-D-glucosamine dehydrogenase